MGIIKTIGKHLGYVKKPKKDDVVPPWLLCPHCETKIHQGNLPKQRRESRHYVHYLCQCGGVSHWMDVMVMVLIGFGRYRTTPSVMTQAPRYISRFIPNRLLPQDVLWLCTNTHVVYFFKKNTLCRFTLDDLPRTVEGSYRFEILAVGRHIHLGTSSYVYDGYQFAPTHRATDDHHIYSTDIDFSDVIRQPHKTHPTIR